jgi:hypothetical protein
MRPNSQEAQEGFLETRIAMLRKLGTFALLLFATGAPILPKVALAQDRYARPGNYFYRAERDRDRREAERWRQRERAERRADRREEARWKRERRDRNWQQRYRAGYDCYGQSGVYFGFTDR